MLLYIEYARKLPFTGGELVYVCLKSQLYGDIDTDIIQLDDALPKPRLLAYTLYRYIPFVCVWHLY